MHRANVNRHLVLIGSEQVMPNLEAALHYLERGELAQIHVLHTADEGRSRGPSERLGKLLHELHGLPDFPAAERVQASLDPAPVGITPQEVRARIEQLRGSAPDASWVINVTGGLKLMAFGATGLPSYDNVELIYQERSEGWFRLRQDQQGRMSAEPHPGLGSGRAHLTDRLPVDMLVRTQFAGADQFEFRHKGAPEEMDLAAFAERGVAAGWEWSDLAESERPGFAFERFVAAAIPRLGVHNALRSLEIRDRASGKLLHEMDIVLCHRGVVTLLDLKLRQSEQDMAMFEQMRVARQTGQSIGGINARVVLIRPNWVREDSVQRLARALNVTLLDQDDTDALFTRLGELLGATPDANLRATDHILAEGKRRLGYALAAPRPEHAVAARNAESETLQVEAIALSLARLRGQNWIVVRERTGVCLWLFAAEPEAEAVPLLDLVMPNRTVFMHGEYRPSNSGRQAWITWQPGPDRPLPKLHRLHAALEPAAGRAIAFTGFNPSALLRPR